MFIKTGDGKITNIIKADELSEDDKKKVKSAVKKQEKKEDSEKDKK